MNLKSKLNQNRFFKNFAALFSATLFSQIINVAASPLITRIYSPGEFGYYSFYLSVCTLLIVYTTGRYEFAINTVKTDRESQTLFKAVLTLSILSTIALCLIASLFHDYIIKIFGLEVISNFIFYIPLTLLVMGVMQALNYYLNRHKEFAILSKGRVLQSSTNSGGSILLGLMGIHSFGLILSNLLGLIISIFYQIFSKKLGFLFNVRKYRLTEILTSIKEHRHYPMYNSTSALFDNLALQAPIFILMRFFSETIVGFYSLTVRIVGMPVSLISTSIAQVFLSEIAELHSDNKPFSHILRKVLKILAVIGLVPMVFLLLTGPWLFIFVFGEEWEMAGELSRILAFSYYAKFVVSPLSMVFFVKKSVKLLSLIQASRALSTVTLLWTSSLFLDIYGVVLLYSLHEILFYLIYLYFIFRVSKKD